MSLFPAAFDRLVEKFASLPGIGMKSAQRLTFHLLDLSDEEVFDFADAVRDAKKKICFCKTCQNLSDSDECSICRSNSRDGSVICVVASPRDVAAIERGNEYNGKYHVLHGVISPLNHIGPDDIRIRELVERVSNGGIDEVIMAMDPDTEGETTARYISRLLHPFGVKVTQLAYGVPVGMSLEFSDDATLMRALEGRREI